MDETPSISTFLHAAKYVLIFASKNYFPASCKLEFRLAVDGTQNPVTNIILTAHDHSGVCVNMKIDLVYSGRGKTSAIEYDEEKKYTFYDVDTFGTIRNIIRMAPTSDKDGLKFSEITKVDFNGYIKDVWEAFNNMKNELLVIYSASQKRAEYQFGVHLKKK